VLALRLCPLGPGAGGRAQGVSRSGGDRVVWGPGRGGVGPTAGVGQRGEATSEAAPLGCTRGVTP